MTNGLLTAGELAALQAAVTATLDQSVTIQRRATTQGPTGNVIPTYSTHATTTCHLAQPTAGQLQQYGGKLGSLAAFRVRLPAGTDVQATDHLVVGGRTLEVQVLLTPRSYSLATDVLASEVK